MNRWLILFCMLRLAVYGQQTVEGKIVDRETGNPVAFASIGLEGTTTGTSSNLNGEFSISVTEPFSLKVICIGYESVVVDNLADLALIQLKPTVIQLNTVIVTDKTINARKIMRKALAAIPDNYSQQPFLQKFFYRHYCKDGDTYGRLIEAYVDVWKDQGYRSVRKSAGDREQIRVTQLRRSLDKTEVAQGHEPLSIGNILQVDMIGYQTTEAGTHKSFYTDMSDLKNGFQNYTFACKGITYYDGQEVYEMTYSYKEDSVLTTSGAYLQLTRISGSLFITTDTYAFVKTEELKSYEGNTLFSSVYYRKNAGKYYPYHFIREGNSGTLVDKHSFHIELMSVEVKAGEGQSFTSQLPGREELLDIPYDSTFWASHTILKTTPLEDEIIRDLGGGDLLNKQFLRYRQYQMNVRDGGKNGEEKFNWLREDSKGNRILYLAFWSGDFKSYLAELEQAKQLQKKYRNKVMFVLLSLDDDETRWAQVVEKYNLFSNGVVNYRIGSQSKLIKSLNVNGIPAFILLARSGERFNSETRRPSDPLLDEDFRLLMAQQF